MKRNKAALCALILSFCLGMTFALQPVEAQAASKPATASNGKHLYYIHYTGLLCRLDTNTGKNKVISKKAGCNSGDVVYHKGYLYWGDNHQDSELDCVVRMKATGGKIQKLAKHGHSVVVYGNKIYYYGDIDDYSGGIFRMDLNGKNKKKIVPKADYSFQIVNNRIYYSVPQDGGAYLHSVNLSGKAARRESSEAVGQICSDGRNLYYTTEGAVHRISGKTGKDKKLPNFPWASQNASRHMEILDVHDGAIYFADSKTNVSKLKKYIVSKGTTIKLKSFKKGSIWKMWVGKGKYAALRVSDLPPKPKDPSGWPGCAAACIKKNGKGYKVLKTVYLP